MKLCAKSILNKRKDYIRRLLAHFSLKEQWEIINKHKEKHGDNKQ